MDMIISGAMTGSGSKPGAASDPAQTQPTTSVAPFAEMLRNIPIADRQGNEFAKLSSFLDLF